MQVLISTLNPYISWLISLNGYKKGTIPVMICLIAAWVRALNQQYSIQTATTCNFDFS